MYNIKLGTKKEDDPDPDSPIAIGIGTSGRPSLFLLVSVFPQTLFAFVSGHFVFLSFLTAWHGTFWFWNLLLLITSKVILSQGIRFGMGEERFTVEHNLF